MSYDHPQSAKDDLCSFCKNHGLPELLLSTIEPDIKRSATFPIHDWESIKVSYCNDQYTSKGRPTREKYVELGTASNIKARKCPFCDIVSHLLFTELDSRESLARFTVVATINMINSGDPTPLPDNKDRRIFIVLHTPSYLIALGSIRCSFIYGRGHLYKTPDLDDYRHPYKYVPYRVDIDRIKSLLELFDDVIATKTRGIQDQDPPHKNQLEAQGAAYEGSDTTESDDHNYVSRPLIEGYFKFSGASRLDSRCQSLSESKSSFKILLVDVKDKCITTATVNESYLALSYVWGNVQDTLQVTKSNKNQLIIPGVLEKKGIKERIPRVIQDAMNFTLRLGKRYIWVDALCIVQDDDDMKKKHLGRMDWIYQKAYLTLVAWTATSSNTPLPGIEGTLRPQIIERRVQHMVLENRLSDDLPLLIQYHQMSHYGTRAWTFQERILSSRCLFFHRREPLLFLPNGIMIGTQTSSMDRETATKVLQMPNLQPGLAGTYDKMGLRSGGSQFAPYARLVEHYTGLNMTKPEDKLNAFKGTLAVIERYTGPLVQGMPTRMLPLSLLWRPPKSSPLTRNKGFPSWSWAGWMGNVFFPECSMEGLEVDFENTRISKTMESAQYQLWSSDYDFSHHEDEAISQDTMNGGFPRDDSEEDCNILHFKAETIKLDDLWFQDELNDSTHLGGFTNGTICWKPEYEFIRVATRRSDRILYSLLTSRKGDIAERVRMCEFREEDWKKYMPVRKEIHLS